ncbi:hypothetical protein M427DRAFT_42606 [Gonapodya prolifera JEL478]|uniref:Uncharacterized protein n=1 Tax=Gonapodya prolifera (strain JEL478) TaxID=1344416 RepID=A0A139AN59_GONPJ|nr:hypothetical protein M427DRAFT_42606 [Gonapodya prolifera JEL478]|eukprot:KXS18177.1 hypothetical protein M427DRAFT_42606 [Gonapodya prolifera JEL478]
MDAGGGRHDFTWPPSTATSPPSRHKRHRDDDDDVQGLEGLEIRTGTDLDTTLSMSGGGQRTDPAFGFPSPPRSAKRIRKTGSSSSQMAGSLASGGVIIEDVSYDDWANGRPTTQGVVTSPSGSPTSRLRGNTSEINLEPARVVELNDEARDPQQAYPTQYFPSTFSVPPSLPFSVPFEQIHPPTPPPTISPSAIRPLGKVQFDTSAFESDSADACTSLVPIARRPPSPTPSVLCIDPILNDAWRARRRQWDFGDRRPVVPGFGLDMGPRRGSEVILFRSSAPEAQSQDAIEEWERIPDERIQEVTDIEDVGGTSSVDRDGMVTESGTDEDQRSDSAIVDADGHKVSIADTLNAVREARPAAVGFTVTGKTCSIVEDWARRVKDFSQAARIMSSSSLREDHTLDSAQRTGEGEPLFPEIVKIFKSKATNKYRLQFLSALPGVLVRGFPVDRVLDELERLSKDMGVREVSLVDDVLTVQPSRLLKLCNGIIDRGHDISWYCNCRADQVSHKLASAMFESGCH